ncbi:MAG: GerW family sporulation protein [Lachnospiraceae bacterium]|nr:GerW family sporulation protein [Lachnospiraceae bacterium]
MAENSNFNETVASMFKGMDRFISSKSVVGEPIQIDAETVILPLVDVSFGVGAGAMAGNCKNNAAGGLGGKVQPSAVLVFKNGQVRVVNIKNQDAVTKIIDMAPDLISRFTHKDNINVDDVVNEAFGDRA